MGPAKGLRNHVKLEFGVFTSLLFLCSLKADLDIVKTPSPIQALLGNDVMLPCSLTGDNNRQLDLSIVGIRWKKISSNGSEIDVYKFLSLRHYDIRPGSFIEERELKRGNASLTLPRVQRSDEGEYSCTIFVTPNKVSANIVLQFLAQPGVTLPTTELIVELGSEKSITCDVSKYYPEAVTIRWVKYSKTFSNRSSLDKSTYFTVPEEYSDGTFGLTSLLTVKPSSLEESGEIYICNVRHASFSHGNNVTFTLTVKEPPISGGYIGLIISCTFVAPIIIALLVLYFKPAPPKVSDITGLDDLAHGKSTTLSCMVSGYKPRNITIQFCLERDGDPIVEEIGSWRYPPPKPLHKDTVLQCLKPEPQRNDTVDHSGNQEELQPLGSHKKRSSLVDPKTLKSVRSYFSYNCFCFANIFTDMEKHKGAKLVIKVTHSALKTPQIISNPLKIDGDFLRLSTIRAPQFMKHGEEVTLTCEIFKCSSNPLHIIWLKKDLMREQSTLTVCKKGEPISKKYEYNETVESRGHVLCTSSSLTFNMALTEDHRAKYICKVNYPAIGQTSQSCQETFVTDGKSIEQHLQETSSPPDVRYEEFDVAKLDQSVPKVEQIQSSRKEHYVGQQVELSCRIHSFNPKCLILQWYKEDDMLPSPDYKLETGNDGLSSTTSILTYIPMIEDKGKVFKCIVDHQGFTDPEVRYWIMEDLITGNTKN